MHSVEDVAMIHGSKKILRRVSFCTFAGLIFLWGCPPDPPPDPPPVDYQGLAEPDQPYGTMIERVAAFLMSDIGEGGILEDQGQPVPPYFYSLGICDRADADFQCESSTQLTLPISFPAYTCYVAIEAFYRYYVYSGNTEALDRAVQFAEWVLRHLTPVTDAVPGFPYSSQFDGVMGGGSPGDQATIELDKAALFSLGLLTLHEAAGDPRYYNTAKSIGDRLLSLQKEDGSWSYRVYPASGEVYQEYTSDQIPFVKLMERLFRKTGNTLYQEAGERAWQWLLDNPVQTKYWANFYEDMDDPESLVNVDTLETIRELLARRHQVECNYLDLARSNFQWVEDLFLLIEAPYPPMIPSIAEQTGFASEDGILAGTSSSTAQWATVSLDMHQAIGEERFLRHGGEAANVVVSAQQADGRMFTVTADANGAGLYPITWYEQCFVPLNYILEFMGKRPGTAPDDETHMLSYSVPVQEIVYEPRRVRYRTQGPGTEVLKTAFPVEDVITSGVGAEWEYDPESGLLRVQHVLPVVEVILSD